MSMRTGSDGQVDVAFDWPALWIVIFGTVALMAALNVAWSLF
jgi:hypothetical protein